MITLLALAALAVVAVTATLVALPKDGYRRIPTDWSRLP
jgi:hypothetical protein